MEIFDDNLRRMAKRSSDSSDNTLIDIWYLIFNSKNELYRNYLEERFNLFSETTQKKFKAKLNKDFKGFYETINEMIIGSHFRTLGYSVEYEPNICGQTPDLIIETPYNQKFIVDIFTSNIPTYIQSQSNAATILLKSIEKLPFSVQLFGDISNPYIIEENIQKITNEISNWLKSKPKIKEQFSSNGVKVSLSRYTDKSQIIAGFNIDDSKRNDYRDLQDKIIKKAIKYKKISENLKMPFIVAIVFNQILVDSETIENLICNSPFSYLVTRYFHNKNGEKVIEGIFAPNGKGGMFKLEDEYNEGTFREKILSGVVTFGFHSRVSYETNLLKNPKATFPLPEELHFN